MFCIVFMLRCGQREIWRGVGKSYIWQNSISKNNQGPPIPPPNFGEYDQPADQPNQQLEEFFQPTNSSNHGTHANTDQGTHEEHRSQQGTLGTGNLRVQNWDDGANEQAYDNLEYNYQAGCQQQPPPYQPYPMNHPNPHPMNQFPGN